MYKTFYEKHLFLCNCQKLYKRIIIYFIPVKSIFIWIIKTIQVDNGKAYKGQQEINNYKTARIKNPEKG